MICIYILPNLSPFLIDKIKLLEICDENTINNFNQESLIQLKNVKYCHIENFYDDNLEENDRINAFADLLSRNIPNCKFLALTNFPSFIFQFFPSLVQLCLTKWQFSEKILSFNINSVYSNLENIYLNGSTILSLFIIVIVMTLLTV